MSNAYLYVFSPKDFTAQEVAEHLDTIREVENWFYSIPNAVFIVGTLSARTLSTLLVDRFGKHRHFITLVSKKARAGWMPKEHWTDLPSE